MNDACGIGRDAQTDSAPRQWGMMTTHINYMSYIEDNHLADGTFGALAIAAGRANHEACV